MSKRVENLDNAIDLVDTVEAVVDEVADKVFNAIGFVREKVYAERDRAIKNAAADEEAERRTKETVEKYLNFVKTNPTFKNFIDVVVKPAKDAGTVDVGDVPVSEPVSNEPTRDEKVKAVRDYYMKHFGIAVWPRPDDLSDDVVDLAYRQTR